MSRHWPSRLGASWAKCRRVSSRRRGKRRVPLPEQVAERERVTNHDLAAFVDLLGESAGADAARWVHYGLTSSDVLDTAAGVILAESADLLLTALEALFETVRDRARPAGTHTWWAGPTASGRSPPLSGSSWPGGPSNWHGITPASRTPARQ